jgi:hypothetical protein
MTIPSRLLYLLWRTGLWRRNIAVRLNSGERLVLCDYLYELNAAYEVFVGECYKCPHAIDKSEIRRIVDVGSNVGYSLAYWAAHFPMALIEAFEPHPKHVALIRRCLRLNGIEDRVILHATCGGYVEGQGPPDRRWGSFHDCRRF